MRVKVIFHGILADWMKTEEAEFSLRKGSQLGDLLLFIGKRYSQAMPEQLWDRKANTFTKAVWAMRGTQRILSHREPLEDGEVIRFLLMQAGG